MMGNRHAADEAAADGCRTPAAGRVRRRRTRRPRQAPAGVSGALVIRPWQAASRAGARGLSPRWATSSSCVRNGVKSPSAATIAARPSRRCRARRSVCAPLGCVSLTWPRAPSITRSWARTFTWTICRRRTARRGEDPGANRPRGLCRTDPPPNSAAEIFLRDHLRSRIVSRNGISRRNGRLHRSSDIVPRNCSAPRSDAIAKCPDPLMIRPRPEGPLQKSFRNDLLREARAVSVAAGQGDRELGCCWCR